MAVIQDIENLGGGGGFGGFGGRGIIDLAVLGLVFGDGALGGRGKGSECCPPPNLAELITTADRDVLQNRAECNSNFKDLVQFICSEDSKTNAHINNVETEIANTKFELAQEICSVKTEADAHTAELLAAIEANEKQRIRDELEDSKRRCSNHDLLIQIQNGGYRNDQNAVQA